MKHPFAAPAESALLSRGFLLAVGLLAIVGIGCASITLQPPADRRAQEQFRSPAEKGDPQAQYRLGMSYRYGTSGMPLDLAEARRWLGLSAEKGYRDARVALGELYLAGGPGLAPDGQQALGWLTQAAEQGAAADQLWLAQLLEEGRKPLLPPDPAAARRWYERSAATSLAARHSLGRLWERGIGGPQDEEVALKWYVLAESALDVDRLEARLGPRQTAAARKAAREWRP